jgi:hypothetical protein
MPPKSSTIIINNFSCVHPTKSSMFFSYLMDLYMVALEACKTRSFKSLSFGSFEMTFFFQFSKTFHAPKYMGTWVSSWYHNRNHDTHLSYALGPKTRISQNECFAMLNSESGISMFRLSTNKYYNE